MPSLTVSANARYLVRPDGTPFFYLGDTAWELFHRLNREEADVYLTDRAAKGFTVIQAVVIAEFDGLHTPNAYGALPLIDDDPVQPNEAYFQHVDAIVKRAADLGLFVAMLPTWGDKVGPILWGQGPEIFTPKNARAFGEFLGKRYRDMPIIWVLGGDRPTETPEQLAIWRGMAAGLKAGDQGQHLISYHPFGQHSSAEFVHHEDWLDFNMTQTGHGPVTNTCYPLLTASYQQEPTKPVIDGEPRYEHIPQYLNVENPRYTDADVRHATYWSLFAGSCGITYGCCEIYQFWDERREPICDAILPWQKALHLPGAGQMRHARALFESRPFLKLRPAQSLIIGGNPDEVPTCEAMCAEDGSFAFVYLPEGETVTIATALLTGDEIQASWYDPRTGAWAAAGQFPRTEERKFAPPTSGPGQDWILVLDDAHLCGG